jgi:chromosome partitioning protein
MGIIRMNIALVAKKGGVGKSTMSLLIAQALRQAGRQVAVNDWDEQGTSTKSCRINGGEIAIPGGEYDYLIYDTKPDLKDSSTKSAVTHADVVIVVTTPSTPDMWEAKEAVEFVKHQNPNAIVRVLINRVKRGTLLAKGAADAADVLGISVPVLNTQILDRQVYAHFIGGGWKTLDLAAQKQVGNLAVEVLTLNNSKPFARPLAKMA